MLGVRTLQKTELAGWFLPDQPKYDVWGREALRSQFPGSDWVYRILVPIRNQEARTFVADQLLLNWNQRNPDQEALPHAPQPQYKFAGETKHMTPAQYADYCRLAGETARLALSKKSMVTLDPNNPTAGAVEWIKAVVAESRGLARGALIQQWHGEGGQVDTAKLAEVAQAKVAKAWRSGRKPKAQLGEGEEAIRGRVESWVRRQEGRRELLETTR